MKLQLALNWNLGEEVTNTIDQLKSFAEWFKALDPYDHPIVLHTGKDNQNDIYGPLYGFPFIDGASIQSIFDDVFDKTLASVQASAAAGRPWIVASDEQGPSQIGLVPDSEDASHDEFRREVLYGNIMAGMCCVDGSALM